MDKRAELINKLACSLKIIIISKTNSLVLLFLQCDMVACVESAFSVVYTNIWQWNPVELVDFVSREWRLYGTRYSQLS